MYYRSYFTIYIYNVLYSSKRINLISIISFRGSSEATKQAHTLIAALIKDPDVDILQMLPKSKLTVVTTSSWDKTISTAAVSYIK